MPIPITVKWISFEDAEVPMNVREKILEALNWIAEGQPHHAAGIGIYELLAQRMVNLYLMGVEQGLKIGRENFRTALKEIGG